MQFISKEDWEIIEAQRKALVTDKKQSHRDRVTSAFHETFELVGGVPRLALWANENYGSFAKLYLRSGGQSVDLNHSGEIVIRPALPLSPLDKGEND